MEYNETYMKLPKIKMAMHNRYSTEDLTSEDFETPMKIRYKHFCHFFFVKTLMTKF